MIWVLFLLISRSKIRLYILLIFLSFWIFFQKNGRHTIVFLKTKFYHFFHYDMDIGVIFTYFFDQKYCTISAQFSQFLDFLSKKIVRYTSIFQKTKMYHFFTNIVWVFFLLIFLIKNTVLYLSHFLCFLALTGWIYQSIFD